MREENPGPGLDFEAPRREPPKPGARPPTEEDETPWYLRHPPEKKTPAPDARAPLPGATRPPQAARLEAPPPPRPTQADLERWSDEKIDFERPALALSIVLATRNQVNRLVRCVELLADQYLRAERYEIIVVDDHSTDETRAQMLRISTRCDLRYAPSPGRGLLAALNYGVELATGDHVLLLSDDILAPPSLLEAHRLAHREVRHKVVRGPVVLLDKPELPGDDGPPPVARGPFTLLNSSFSKVAFHKVGGLHESARDPEQELMDITWRLRLDGWEEHYIGEAYCYRHNPDLPRDIDDYLALLARTAARSAVAHLLEHPRSRFRSEIGLGPLARLSRSLTGGDAVRQMCRNLRQSGIGRSYAIRCGLEQKIYTSLFHQALTEEARKAGL
jgi:glycosyltransferase involved in cell wall biosynthesis